MKVLLAGESDVLLRSAVDALRARSHEVRLISSRAQEIAGEWPAHVEPWMGPSVRDAAAGCDVVLDLTALNAGGRSHERTPGLVDAAAAAGIRRFVRVRPRSIASRPDAADERVSACAAEWLVLGVDHVYGGGADLVSLLLIMMRALPAVPILRGRTFSFQPTWHEDVAAALASSVELEASMLNRALQVAGPDLVTQDDMYERIATLIDRRPVRMPLPELVATHAASLAAMLRIVPETYVLQLETLRDVPPLDGGGNALLPVFGVTPTSFDRGLARLVNEQPELTPAEGIGTLQIKRFSVDIPDSQHEAAELLRLFRSRFRDVMPVAVGVEPASRETELNVGTTVTLALPGRGHVQVRVQEVTDHYVIVATLKGHALAGIVRFSATARDRGVRFEILTCDTAANTLDWATLTAGAARAQDANWQIVLQNVASMAGGNAQNLQADIRNVDDQEADHLDAWVRSIIQRRRRAGKPESPVM